MSKIVNSKGEWTSETTSAEKLGENICMSRRNTLKHSTFVLQREHFFPITCSTFWIFLWYSTASTLLCVSVRLLWLKLPDISPWDFAEPRQRRRSWCRKQLQLAWVHWQSRSFPVSHPAGPHGAGLWMCLQMLASRVRRVAPLVGLKGQLRPTILALWCQIQGWAAMWAPSIYNAQMVMEDHRTLFL